MAAVSGFGAACLSLSREILSPGSSPIYPRPLLLAALHKRSTRKKLQDPLSYVWQTSHILGTKRLDRTPLPAYSISCRQGKNPSITNRLG